MTNHSLPTGPAGSEGDSEKKKWGYKRQQFDAVISTTRFNGAIDKLVDGQVEVRALLAILDELNASNQRGRYMAEVLALKQESRRLAAVPFAERVAEFLVEGSRRIPWLSDGLASQMAVALASAADNPFYLDTVNAAVSNLLLDLDRPLKSDTRNFLRALTDKIDATRRLQEARGHLATVPSVYPPVIPEQLANAQSPEPPSVERAPIVESPSASSPLAASTELQSEADAPDEITSRQGRGQVVSVDDEGHPSSDDYFEPAPVKAGPKFTTQRTLMMPVAEPPLTATQTSGEQPPPKPTTVKTLSGIAAESPEPDATAPSAQASTPNQDLRVLEGAVTVLADAVAMPEPTPATSTARRPLKSRAPSKGHIATKSATSTGLAGQQRSATPPQAPSQRLKGAPAQVESEDHTQPGLGEATQTAPGIAPTRESPVESSRGPAAHPSPDPAGDDSIESVKIPTSHIPTWLIGLAVGGVVVGAIGFWMLLSRSETSETAALASASASVAPAASGSAATKSAKRRGRSAAKSAKHAPPPPPQAAPPPPPIVTPPPPPPPPPAAVAPPPKAPKAATAPIVRTPPAPPNRPVAVTKPVAVSEAPASKPTASKPETESNKPKTAAATETLEPRVVPTTPKPTRTIDDILVEILQVPNDPASIEAKAHEVARVVARAPKADAEHILQRLIPEEVLAGTETVDTRSLEPVRLVVALMLKKVAMDKDDNRAALAIASLGEWAKLRKHGAAAKLTLDQLAEERVVISRPKRLRALQRVQARLGISNVGE